MDECTEGFEVFVRIVEHGSVSAAARALEQPRETLSRRLARLEARLGVRLLHRETRRLTLTLAGEELYRRASPLVAAAQEANAAVRRLDDEPRGLLRLSLPPEGGLLAEMCLDFADRYPEVQLELISTARFVDLVAEQVDVALRAGTLGDPALVARRLWATDLVAVATPAYLEGWGRPASPADLADHACILGYEEGLRPERRWPLLAGGTVAVKGRIATNNLRLRRIAIERGEGIGLMPRFLVEEALRSGQLEPLLEGQVGGSTGMAVVFVERAFMLPKVRAFVDHAVAWFQDLGDAGLRRDWHPGSPEQAGQP